MIKIINTLKNINDLFVDGDFNIDKWQNYINKYLNNQAHLFLDEMNDYLISGIYTFEDNFQPIINNVYQNPKSETLITNFNKVTFNLNEKVKTVLGKELDVDIVLYLGLCNAAGWVTKLDGKVTILLGVEKILELDWIGIDDLYGLIYHELGHVYHYQYGNLDLEKDNSFVHQLYSEGIAMYIEQLLVGNMNYYHQDKNNCLAFCEDSIDLIKEDFDNDLTTMNQLNQRYFGDWANYYGFGDVGYYLGTVFVKNILLEKSLIEVVNLTEQEVLKHYKSFMGK